MRKFLKDMLLDQFNNVSSKRVLAFVFAFCIVAIVGFHLITGRDVQEAIITAVVALVIGMVGGSVAEHWSKKIKS